MRVLDLGSGPGDVSFQVAEIVGPEGSVVGIEQDQAQIAVATRRRDQLGLRNVDFRQGDARTFVDEEPFDAAVCRLLLMHLPDAADVLAHQMQNLRPGASSSPWTTTWAVRARYPRSSCTHDPRWLRAGFEHADVDPFVGMRLLAILGEAGYEEIGSLGLQSYWAPENPQAAGYVVGVVRAMKDAIVASGAATEDELGLDTLEQRLAAALRASNAVYTVPTIVAGWGRRP